MDSLSIITNVISCAILTLIVRLIYKSSREIKVGTEDIDKHTKLDFLQILAHVLVTFSFTLSQFLIVFQNSLVQDTRM